MSHAAFALLAGLIFGGIFSLYVAPRSIREAKIYGGTLAKAFHYLGVLGFCMTLPTVIAAVVVRGGFALAFPLGVGCVISAFIALLIFAAVERPARLLHAPEEDVWTAEKARSSGL
ncbi:MAG TPA: hypothetical protein VHD90_25235 [Phototrophicaceae bacterium]|nr:hypothetical protein [Phototrophicaceae bacterium]